MGKCIALQLNTLKRCYGYSLVATKVVTHDTITCFDVCRINVISV